MQEPSTRPEPVQQDQATQEQRTDNGANQLLGFGIITPPTAVTVTATDETSQDTDLRAAAPPTYQVDHNLHSYSSITLIDITIV